MADKPVGRHSAGDQTAFYRSALLWFLPWLIVAVVAIAAVWIAVDALGSDVQPPPTTPERKAAVPAGEPSPTESETPEPEETEEASPSPEPSKSPSEGDGNDEDAPKLITEGVTVQVLNGTADAEADDRVAEQLEHLGYEIAAINPYLARPDTIVYFSSKESQKAAEALAAHFEWPVQPKPADLSSEVSIHIIVGADELMESD